MHDLSRRLPASAFRYQNGSLHCEGVALDAIADSLGTPFYCYSAGRLRERYRAFAAALAPLGVGIHFAMKANGNQAVLKLFASEGAGTDIVSGGELARSLAAGIPGDRIIFSGVGKTAAEIDAALASGVHQLNVESFEELRLVDAIAARRGVVASVALRINPDVDAETHAKITTGKKDNKFGIDVALLDRLDNEVKALQNVRILGVAAHIGSQIMKATPLIAAYRRLGEIADDLKRRGLPIERIDLGGGFGIPYRGEAELTPASLATAIAQTVAGRGYHLAVEPGRTLVADAGVLVAGVTYVKDAGHMRFLVLDAAMNDLVRPAMYDAHHDIVPVNEPAADADLTEYDVVGPICESSDTFDKHIRLPEMRAGERVVLATAGAYGATMSSTYNARALAPEVLVDGNRFAVIRRRIDIAEQIGWDQVPEWM
ncbi:MAG: diaminopimelate decarboxylase [Ancalomicrobiaceae bacterium]|nr:diaminopimelate decarboxylase [Ancalomicrobiaceae bacterium]